jgi:hypothetical protein
MNTKTNNKIYWRIIVLILVLLAAIGIKNVVQSELIKDQGSISVSYDTWNSTNDLFCIRKGASLKNGVHTYYKQGEITITNGVATGSMDPSGLGITTINNNTLSYILSNVSATRSDALDDANQVSLWLEQNWQLTSGDSATDPKWHLNWDRILAGSKVSIKATAYTNFVEFGVINYEPKVKASSVNVTDNNNQKIVGPFSVDYKVEDYFSGRISSNFGDKGWYYYGEITKMQLEGKEITAKDICDDKGNSIANSITNELTDVDNFWLNGFPRPNKEFYIKVPDGVSLDGENTIKVWFNNKYRNVPQAIVYASPDNNAQQYLLKGSGTKSEGDATAKFTLDNSPKLKLIKVDGNGSQVNGARFDMTVTGKRGGQTKTVLLGSIDNLLKEIDELIGSDNWVQYHGGEWDEMISLKLKETAAPSGYESISEEMTFEIRRKGTIDSTTKEFKGKIQVLRGTGRGNEYVELKGEGTNSIEIQVINEKIEKTQLKLIKVDENGSRINGARFSISFAHDIIMAPIYTIPSQSLGEVDLLELIANHDEVWNGGTFTNVIIRELQAPSNDYEQINGDISFAIYRYGSYRQGKFVYDTTQYENGIHVNLIGGIDNVDINNNTVSIINRKKGTSENGPKIYKLNSQINSTVINNAQFDVKSPDGSINLAGVTTLNPSSKINVAGLKWTKNWVLTQNYSKGTVRTRTNRN